MRIADITLAVFTFCNSLRFLACLPQSARAVRDQSGTQAISLGTWGLFFISHASAMAYALVNNEDWIMAFMFLANAIGCGAVLLITAWKRSQHRAGQDSVKRHPQSSASLLKRWDQASAKLGCGVASPAKRQGLGLMAP